MLQSNIAHVKPADPKWYESEKHLSTKLCQPVRPEVQAMKVAKVQERTILDRVNMGAAHVQLIQRMQTLEHARSEYKQKVFL